VHDQPAALAGGHQEERAMGKRISKSVVTHELEPASLSELIHQHVRVAIETAVHEELGAALGASPYERSAVRRGYRNGIKTRTLTGPTGPVALTVPRATLFNGAGAKEWTSTIIPRYQRRLPDVNEAVVATYLAGGNTRRIRGALQPLLRAAPLSKSAVSRVVATLKSSLEAWRARPLTDLDVIYIYLDGFALRVRSAEKVVSVRVMGVIGVFPDGHKHLLALELCGGESFASWKGCLDDLVARGLRAPVLAIIDGNAGLRRAVGLVWPTAAVQRCCVHKLRNLTRKAPKHVLAEIREDFHRIVYAVNADTARTAHIPGEHVASMDADPDPKRRQPGSLPMPVEPLERLLYGARALNGMPGGSCATRIEGCAEHGTPTHWGSTRLDNSRPRAHCRLHSERSPSGWSRHAAAYTCLDVLDRPRRRSWNGQHVGLCPRGGRGHQ
jgi:transposase-like protein